MLEVGVVSARDEGGHRVRVRFPARDDLESGWLAVMVSCAREDAAFGLPAIEEQVVVLLAGQEEWGVVLGALYSEVDPPPPSVAKRRGIRFEDGALIDYDPEHHVLRAEMPAGGKVVINGDDIEAGGVDPLAMAGDVKGHFEKVSADLVTVFAAATAGTPTYNFAAEVALRPIDSQNLKGG